MVIPTHSNPAAPVLSHFNLTGKTAIVTGGCRGIGLEVARGLAEAGAKVAVTYSSTPPEDAARIAEELSRSGNGVTVKAYRCNVKSKADVEATVNRVTEELGGGTIDICVANAGIAAHIPALEYSEEDWRTMMDVNFHGAFWTAQAAARIFERQWKAGGSGRASIIFTASVSAILVNIPQRQAAYNASKAAVVHLAKSLAVEWVDFARVNCISPGFISTDSKSQDPFSCSPPHTSTPLSSTKELVIDTLPEEWRKKWPELIPGTRFCDPAELKGAYVFLASEASSYMTGMSNGFSALNQD